MIVALGLRGHFSSAASFPAALWPARRGIRGSQPRLLAARWRGGGAGARGPLRQAEPQSLRRGPELREAGLSCEGPLRHDKAPCGQGQGATFRRDEVRSGQGTTLRHDQAAEAALSGGPSPRHDTAADGSSLLKTATAQAVQDEVEMLNTMEVDQGVLALTQAKVSNQLLAAVLRRKDFDLDRSSLPTREAPAVDPAKLMEDLGRPVIHILPLEDAVSLLSKLEKLLEKLESPVVDVRLPESGDDPKLVVVGDTHGQLQDVLHIFETIGPPSESTTYLFNGDIVDRGNFAVEIWLLLVAYLLRYPGSVHILRGNHENHQMIVRPKKLGGGFYEECTHKYGAHVFRMFKRIFNLLPLFAVVEEEIFVVHGGLFRGADVSLAQLRQLPRGAWRRNYPDPLSREQTKKGETWTAEDEILFDALWADPHPGFGPRRSSRGRVAVDFGVDITANFLDEAGLGLCIRSHSVPRSGRGYEVDHAGRLLTVFSASRYGGILRNHGAAAVFRASGVPGTPDAALGLSGFRPDVSPLRKLSLRLQEHRIEPRVTGLERSHVAASQLREIISRKAREQQSDVLHHAVGLIIVESEAIRRRCLDFDEGHGLPEPLLVGVLGEICGELPHSEDWSDVCRELLPASSGDVDYEDFLSSPSVRWHRQGCSHVLQVAQAAEQAVAQLGLSDLAGLFAGSRHLRGADAPWPEAGDLVKPEVLRKALAQVLPNVPGSSIDSLVGALFGEEEEEPAELSALLHRLSLFAPEPSLPAPWMAPTLQRLAARIVDRHGPPLHHALFRFFRRATFTDLMAPEEFVESSSKLLIRFGERSSEAVSSQRAQLRLLFEAIGGGSGTVSLLELLSALEHGARPCLAVSPGISGRLAALILVHKLAVSRICVLLDPGGSGLVSADNFVKIVDTLADVVGTPLTETDRRDLEQELAHNDVNYVEAMQCFSLTTRRGGAVCQLAEAREMAVP